MTAIDRARYLMRCRKFSEAIAELDAKRDAYENSFDFDYTMGLAFLYAGNTGDASVYFSEARKIKINNANLLLAQAAIFLRRGDTERAVRYYLDIQEIDKENKQAKKALDFIRRLNGDHEKIMRRVDDGSIAEFYPPLGANPIIVRRVVLSIFGAAVLAAAAFVALRFFPAKLPGNFFARKSDRADLSELALGASGSYDVLQKDLGAENYKYILSEKEVKNAHDKALRYFSEHRDNAAQREVNRILNSNASLYVKKKCNQLTGYFSVPSFGAIKDNYSFEEVIKDPYLYLDCYADWGGRVANILQTENSFQCDLLVGYEDNKRVDGQVRVRFNSPPVPEINSALPLRILGRISLDGGEMVLEGLAVFQSVKDAYGQ